MSKLRSVLRNVFRWITCAEAAEEEARRKVEHDATMAAIEGRIDKLKRANDALDTDTSLAKMVHQAPFDIGKLDYLEAFVDSMIILLPDIKKQKPMQDYVRRVKAYLEAHPEDLADEVRGRDEVKAVGSEAEP